MYLKNWDISLNRHKILKKLITTRPCFSKKVLNCNQDLACPISFCQPWDFFKPRLRSRPKFLSDQTFQTEIVSDQTFQTKFTLIRLSRPKLALIRLSRHKKPLTRLFRPKVFWSDHLQTMDQTQIQTIAQTLIRQTMIRLKCARRGYDQTQLCSKHLWSDAVALAAIYDQSEVRSKPVLIRLKCAQSSLIRERFYLWKNLLLLL